MRVLFRRTARTLLLLHCTRMASAMPWLPASMLPWRTPLRQISARISGLISKASSADEVDYSELRGLPKSLGRDAAEWALAGEVPERSKDGLSLATLAGGCFWGTELHLQRVPGVVATCVGYTQGRTLRPTYAEVCGGRTGHTEACMVLFDPKRVSFTDLCAVLFRTIDPTLRDQVGNDFGTQYRHGIYAHCDAHLREAEVCAHNGAPAAHTLPMRACSSLCAPARSDSRTAECAHDELHTRPHAQSFVAREGKGLPAGKSIVTEVHRATVFWPAEEYHRNKPHPRSSPTHPPTVIPPLSPPPSRALTGTEHANKPAQHARTQQAGPQEARAPSTSGLTCPHDSCHRAIPAKGGTLWQPTVGAKGLHGQGALLRLRAPTATWTAVDGAHGQTRYSGTGLQLCTSVGRHHGTYRTARRPICTHAGLRLDGYRLVDSTNSVTRHGSVLRGYDASWHMGLKTCGCTCHTVVVAGQGLSHCC